MDADTIVTMVEQIGGSLWVDGATLRFKLPDSCRPLIEELREHKAEIVARISQQEQMPSEDPAAWVEDFHRWALSNCRYQDRRFSMIGALHLDFCEWAPAHDSVPCRLQTFERLLKASGFLIADGWVSGLCLARWLTREERKRLEAAPGSVTQRDDAG